MGLWPIWVIQRFWYVFCADRLQMGEVVSTIPSWYSFPVLTFMVLFSPQFIHCLAGGKLWFYYAFPKSSSMVEFLQLNLFIFLGAAIGFNVETVQYNNIKFQVWDLGMLSLLPLISLNLPSTQFVNWNPKKRVVEIC